MIMQYHNLTSVHVVSKSLLYLALTIFTLCFASNGYAACQTPQFDGDEIECAGQDDDGIQNPNNYQDLSLWVKEGALINAIVNNLGNVANVTVDGNIGTGMTLLQLALSVEDFSGMDGQGIVITGQLKAQVQNGIALRVGSGFDKIHIANENDNQIELSALNEGTGIRVSGSDNIITVDGNMQVGRYGIALSFGNNQVTINGFGSTYGIASAIGTGIRSDVTNNTINIFGKNAIAVGGKGIYFLVGNLESKVYVDNGVVSAGDIAIENVGTLDVVNGSIVRSTTEDAIVLAEGATVNISDSTIQANALNGIIANGDSTITITDTDANDMFDTKITAGNFGITTTTDGDSNTITLGAGAEISALNGIQLNSGSNIVVVEGTINNGNRGVSSSIAPGSINSDVTVNGGTINVLFNGIYFGWEENANHSVTIINDGEVLVSDVTGWGIWGHKNLTIDTGQVESGSHAIAFGEAGGVFEINEAVIISDKGFAIGPNTFLDQLDGDLDFSGLDNLQSAFITHSNIVSNAGFGVADAIILGNNNGTADTPFTISDSWIRSLNNNAIVLGDNNFLLINDLDDQNNQMQVVAGNGNGVQAENNNAITLGAGSFINAIYGVRLYGTGNTVVIDGTINSTNNGIDATLNSTNNITVTGKIDSDAWGIVLGGQESSVTLDGGEIFALGAFGKGIVSVKYVNMMNSANIESSSTAIEVTSANGVVTISDSTITTDTGYGIFFNQNAPQVVIDNSTITTGSSVIRAQDNADNADIQISNSTLEVTAGSGSVIYALNNATVNLVNTDAVSTGGGINVAENSEVTIDQSSTISAGFNGIIIGGDSIINVDGAITADDNGMIADGAADSVVYVNVGSTGSVTTTDNAASAIQAIAVDTVIDNAGIITGSIDLDTGTDDLTNSGTISGDINFSGGDDTFTFQPGAVFTSHVADGSDGTDRVIFDDGAGNFSLTNENNDAALVNFENLSVYGNWALGGEGTFTDGAFIKLDSRLRIKGSTLVFNNDVTVESGATVAFRLNENGTNNQMVVNGLLTIEPASTLEVIPVGFLPDGQVYTVVFADDIDGTFSNVIYQTPTLSYEVAYTDLNTIEITVHREEIIDPDPDPDPEPEPEPEPDPDPEPEPEPAPEPEPEYGIELTPNEIATAINIDRVVADILINGLPNNEIVTLINAVDQLALDDLARGLDQLHSASYNGNTLASREISNITTDYLNDRMQSRARRCTVREHSRARCETHVEVWAQVSHTDGDVDGNYGMIDVQDIQIDLALMGADVNLGPATVGVHAGYARSDVSVDMYEGPRGAQGEVEAMLVGAYGNVTLLGGLDIYGSLTYLSTENEHERYIRFDNISEVAKSDFDGSGWVGSLGIDYQYRSNGWFVTPSLEYRYISLDEDGVSERGAQGFNLEIDDRDTNRSELVAGIDAGKSIHLGPGTLDLSLGLSHNQVISEANDNIETRFVSAPVGVGRFDIEVEEPDHYTTFGAKASYRFNNGIEIGVSGELTRGDGYDASRALLEVGFAF